MTPVSQSDAPPTQTPRRPVRREARDGSRIEVADIAAGPDFAAAARHSRRVRLLRIGLPALAVVGIAGYFVASRTGAALDLPVEFDAIVVGDDAVVIERPRLTGFLAGGEAYELAADRAVHRRDSPDLLALDTVDATIQMPGGATAQFNAPAGEYNTTTLELTLTGGVTMTIDNDLNAFLDRVVMDIASGRLRSDRPFELSAGVLTIRAGALDFSPDLLRASGGVETVLAVGVPALAAGGGN